MTHPGTSKTILVVEDDLDVRDVIKLALETEGYYVREADNGLDALTSLETGLVPDLILLDLDMPELNGQEFMNVLGKSIALISIPILVVSAAATEDALFGARAWIKKPLQLPELLAVVRAHTGGR
ncbi:MAG: response regulator [Proteobacteria bacterium]|nr:MAG: response regulator [Pseudomonadota bacterium]